MQGSFIKDRMQQQLQLISCRRAEATQDGGMEALVVSMDRGADDPIDTIGRGRLDRKLATPRFEEHGKLIRCRPDLPPLDLEATLGAARRRRRSPPGSLPRRGSRPNDAPCSTGPIIPIMVIGFHAELSSHSRH